MISSLRTSRGLVAVALVVAVLGWRLWPAGPSAPTPTARTDVQPFSFVRSLDGTTPDDAVHADASDQLVVDAALGRLFDYYLSAQGERSLAAIRSEIEAELGRRLRPHAAQQARDLLGRYLDYKRALVDVEVGLQKGPTAAAQAARARLLAMQDLRKQFFSEKEAAGLFGFEDAYN
ncbi:MAG: lipase chaperone, partial [Pseudomonadota bacterium]|nr:lipase chaperone [Pseudomonadota bacterium]